MKGYRTARKFRTSRRYWFFYRVWSVSRCCSRSRRDYEELMTETAADGIITGMCKINSEIVGEDNSNALAIINDYSVLAGTQGFFIIKN